MRIIAGQLKGRRLDGPTWDGLRPTSDSLRETLFNVLGPTLDGVTVLDAYAGTGALGLEALSRGAAHVTFVDRDPRAIALITRHVERCSVTDACAIIRGDFEIGSGGRRMNGISAHAFDLVLLDPPYENVDLEAVLAGAAESVNADGRVVLEHSRRHTTDESVAGLRRTRVLTAGDSALSFYVAAAMMTN